MDTASRTALKHLAVMVKKRDHVVMDLYMHKNSASCQALLLYPHSVRKNMQDFIPVNCSFY